MGHEGFIVSDKNRKAVFQELASGESDPERIAKKHHLIGRVVERVMGEFREEGLVEDGEDGVVLTDEGERVAGELKKQDLFS